MAITNTGGIPQRVDIKFHVCEAAKPGNATYVAMAQVVETRPRPDGRAAAAATGGSANMRLIVDSAEVQTGGQTDGGNVALTSLNVINVSNANAVVATVTPSNANMAKNKTNAMTIATTSTTRNSVSVPDRILLAGDILNAQLIGTNAGDKLELGSVITLHCHWEDQSGGVDQTVAQGV